jgi:hypothetical protein
VFSEAKRILRDTQTAEEILQDLFYQIWRTAERFDASRDSLAGWLVVAAREVKTTSARWWNWILLPATAALAVFCFALWQQNLQLSKKLEESRREVANLENQRLRVKGLVNVLALPETITVKLAGTDNESLGSGVVRYNLRLGVVAYKAELPQPPKGKISQMWLVPQDGAAISAGVFTQGSPGEDVVWTAQVPPNTWSQRAECRSRRDQRF